jgi:hypothetical protein
MSYSDRNNVISYCIKFCAIFMIHLGEYDRSKGRYEVYLLVRLSKLKFTKTRCILICNIMGVKLVIDCNLLNKILAR